jgi:hypothetical protein
MTTRVWWSSAALEQSRLLEQTRLLKQARQARAADRWAQLRAAQPLSVRPLAQEPVPRSWVPAVRNQQQVLTCCQQLQPQTMPRAQVAYSTQTNTIPPQPEREPRVP